MVDNVFAEAPVAGSQAERVYLRTLCIAGDSARAPLGRHFEASTRPRLRINRLTGARPTACTTESAARVGGLTRGCAHRADPILRPTAACDFAGLFYGGRAGFEPATN